MSIKLITLKCPDCGASIEIEDNREHAFCTYCGAKILIHNENEYVYHYVDEAEVKQAETERELRLKELEIAEKEREKKDSEKEIAKKKAPKWGILAVFFLLVTLFLSNSLGDHNPVTTSFLVLATISLYVCFYYLRNFL